MSKLSSDKKSSKYGKEFTELLFWKKEYKKINKELAKTDWDESQISITELQKRKLFVETKLDFCEKTMFKIDKGLYFGIAYDMADGNSEAQPLIAKWSNLNNHVGVKGTTRVGKTVNMQSHIEQCIAKGMDVIVIDPKGGPKQDILSSVSESCYKAKRSEDFLYFSPAFPSISQRINVCYGLTNIELTGGIIESIKTPTMDTFYLETAEEILMAITSSFEYLQEVSDPTGKITRLLEQKEMKKYYAFLNNKQKEEYDFVDSYDINEDLIEDYERNVFDEQLLLEFEENGFNRSLITFRELEYYSHYKTLRSLKTLVGVVEIDKSIKYRKDVKGLRRDAIILLSSALSTEEKHFAKVSKTLTNRMTALSVGPIGELLCGVRINPLMNRLLRKDKGVVAVIQPFPMKFKKASDVFNKMILGMLDAMMGSVGAEGRALPRRIAIFIDEAGSIAYPGIENFFNRAGGLGITVFVYTQTEEDYKEAVGETLANVILDNVNTTITMKLNALESRVKAAEEIGSFKRMKTMAMISTGAGSEGRYTTDVEEAYICEPNDIKALPVGEGIVMHDGKSYYVEFPFRKPPVAAIKMPSLESELDKRFLSDFEAIEYGVSELETAS